MESFNRRRLEYSDIRDYDNYFRDISGIIVNRKIISDLYEKGTLYLTLNNGNKIYIMGTHRNYLYKKPDLIDFIQINDSISKPNESDFTFIIRGDSIYFFKLNTIINKKTN